MQTPFPDSTIVEGCGDAIVKFERSDTMNNDTLFLNFTGDASSSDYSGLGNMVVFHPDSTSVKFNLSAELDEDNESTEQLFIEIDQVTGCNGALINIENYEDMSLSVSDSINICSQGGETGTVSAYLDGGKDPYIYEWKDVVNGPIVVSDENHTVSPELTTLLVPTIFDACNNDITGDPVPVWVQCPVEPINVFTPNNDGLNDYFEFRYFSQYDQIKLNIFDRWGHLIYENDKYENDWSGESLPDGVYYYIVEVVSTKYEYENDSNSDDEELLYTLNGYVSIMR